jgi:hypothetical protein
VNFFTTLPRRALVLGVASLMISGCVAPGYPYNGAVVTAGGPPPPVAAPYYYTTAAPVVVAPTVYPGFGYGYWYGGGFWPYRNSCGFYNGCYYRGNYGWHGGCYGRYR